MNALGSKQIETEKLILRKIRFDDAYKIYTGWTSDYLVSRYVNWNVHRSVDTTEQYVKYKVERYENNGYCFDWVVELKENHQLIGEIDVVDYSVQDNVGIIGYCYSSKYWNKGYATEALKAVIDYLLNEVGVSKLAACHIATNPASGRVMQKAGMHFESVMPKHKLDKNTNEMCDLLWYAIERKDKE